ncbi:hypothetical protein Ahy_B06g081403 isoform D [Arachis hypogaea]|uniref:Uncharacterized protein n=1 Tax=Arachis hypogaea TaxID=3818 RepID=A0A444YL08_ARAHY|nr:hypothetical protein Ahy_B06g081403 isoform D [Arachis hypogaea]
MEPPPPASSLFSLDTPRPHSRPHPHRVTLSSLPSSRSGTYRFGLGHSSRSVSTQSQAQSPPSCARFAGGRTQRNQLPHPSPSRTQLARLPRDCRRRGRSSRSRGRSSSLSVSSPSRTQTHAFPAFLVAGSRGIRSWWAGLRLSSCFEPRRHLPSRNRFAAQNSCTSSASCATTSCHPLGSSPD